MSTAQDKKYFEEWKQYRDNIRNATPIDLDETPQDKLKRIDRLEANDEEWFKYYFPNYYTSEPAPFHKKSTQRVMNNMEHFEVRSWARELSKSARTMMEDLKLAMTGKKRFFIEASATYESAERLLLPYKSNLECNQRLINDYGVQENIGNWESGFFVTRKGVAFFAIGAGQSPRGRRNEEVRPDKINIDDIDTDEMVKNPQRVKDTVKWIMEALIPTRSISKDLSVVVNGNIIAKYCCVTELAKVADVHDIVNIRDKNGKSTWPSKNSEEAIDRVIKTLSWASAQKEYFNNPVAEGDVFKKVVYDKCPPLASCDRVIVYADPSTSNKDKAAAKQASYKAVGVIGKKGQKIYLYKIWIKQTGNTKFVEMLFEAYDYLVAEKVDIKRLYIENNSLQAPHYEQVITPEIKKQNKARDLYLPITEDTRKKGEKFLRIEGTLEPIHSKGDLIFNISEKSNDDMKVMDGQMLGVAEGAKTMDGPDMLEGGVWILQNKTVQMEGGYSFGSVNNRKF
jgi:hypothetical protein